MEFWSIERQQWEIPVHTDISFPTTTEDLQDLVRTLVQRKASPPRYVSDTDRARARALKKAVRVENKSVLEGFLNPSDERAQWFEDLLEDPQYLAYLLQQQ